MKLSVMLEVDEIFTTIWLSGSSEVRVKVRRWPQSPIRTIFRGGEQKFSKSGFQPWPHIKFVCKFCGSQGTAEPHCL